MGNWNRKISLLSLQLGLNMGAWMNTPFISHNNMIFQTSLFFSANQLCLLLKFFLPSVTMVGMRFGFCDAGVLQPISVLHCKLPNESLIGSANIRLLFLIQVVVSRSWAISTNMSSGSFFSTGPTVWACWGKWQYQATVIIHFLFLLISTSGSPLFPDLRSSSSYQGGTKDLHYYLNHFIKKIIHLALSGLYCHTQNLHCITQYLLFWHTNSLVMACGLRNCGSRTSEHCGAASQCRSTWLSCSTGCGI